MLTEIFVDEHSPGPAELVINPYYTYVAQDFKIILNIRLNEERVRHPGVLDSVYAINPVHFQHEDEDAYERIHGTELHMPVCTSLADATFYQLGQSLPRETWFRMLVPFLGFGHAIAIVIDMHNARCSRIMIIDSGDLSEISPDYKQAILDKLQAFALYINSNTTPPHIVWLGGTSQLGGTCTIYTIENLILAASDRLQVRTLLYRNPLLLRLHHLRVVWQARHHFDKITVNEAGDQVDIFADFYRRQQEDTDPALKNDGERWIVNTPAEFTFEGIMTERQAWCRADRPTSDFSSMSVLATTSKHALLVEALEAEHVLVQLDRTFCVCNIEGYKLPTGDIIYSWLVSLENLKSDHNVTPELTREAIGVPWLVCFLWLSFQYIRMPSETMDVLKHVELHPHSIIDRCGTVDLISAYDEAIAYVTSEERFLDAVEPEHAYSVYIESMERFLSGIGMPTSAVF